MQKQATSKSMYALQLAKYGSPREVLVYNENVPIPQIKSPKEVLIRVKAAGVNGIESIASSGNISFATNFLAKFPSVLGADFSGIIEEKGKEVTEFELGDEVFGALSLPFGPNGTFAQYTVVNVDKDAIAKKPSNLSFEQAGSTGMAALVGYEGIVNFGGLAKNPSVPRKILITAASGGVGGFGVQFAKAINKENYVVGVCSAKNADFVKSLGADEVIDYTNEASYQSFLERSKDTFDVVYECVGGEDYYKKLDPILNKNGIFITPVGPIKDLGSSYVGITQVATILAKIAYIKLFGAHTYKRTMSSPNSEWRDTIAPFFESGAVRGEVKDNNSIIPLKEGNKAFEMINTHRTTGKIVFKMD